MTVLSVTALIFSSCSKDDIEPTTPQTATNVLEGKWQAVEFWSDDVETIATYGDSVVIEFAACNGNSCAYTATIYHSLPIFYQSMVQQSGIYELSPNADHIKFVADADSLGYVNIDDFDIVSINNATLSIDCIDCDHNPTMGQPDAIFKKI